MHASCLIRMIHYYIKTTKAMDFTESKMQHKSELGKKQIASLHHAVILVIIFVLMGILDTICTVSGIALAEQRARKENFAATVPAGTACMSYTHIW